MALTEMYRLILIQTQVQWYRLAEIQGMTWTHTQNTHTYTHIFLHIYKATKKQTDSKRFRPKPSAYRRQVQTLIYRSMHVYMHTKSRKSLPLCLSVFPCLSIVYTCLSGSPPQCIFFSLCPYSIIYLSSTSPFLIPFPIYASIYITVS